MKMNTRIGQILKSKKEKKQQNLGITLIRINPDKEGFDIFNEISEIQSFIYEPGLKLGEELKKNKIIEDLERTVRLIKMSG